MSTSLPASPRACRPVEAVEPVGARSAPDRLGAICPHDARGQRRADEDEARSGGSTECSLHARSHATTILTVRVARDLTRPLASSGATGGSDSRAAGACRAVSLRGSTEPEPSRPARLVRREQRQCATRAGPRGRGLVRAQPAGGARSQARRRSLVAAQRPRDVRGAGRRLRPLWHARFADRHRYRGDRCLVAPRGSHQGPALRPLRVPGLHVEVRLPRSRLRPAAPGRRGLHGGRDGLRTCCCRISRPSKRLRRRSTSSTTTARRRSETRCAGPRSFRAARRRREDSRVLPSSGSSRCAAETWAQERLNAAVAVHELIHGLAALQGSAPNECLPPDDGHVCDSPTDVLYPEASSQTTLSTQILDTGRDDYYGHSGNSFDVQDSAWLSHLPQQRLAVAIQRTGSARGTVRLTSPTAFECAQSCSLQLDLGLSATLVARPAAGFRFAGWKGACSGTAPCVVTLDAARSVVALFGAGTFRLTVGVGGKGRVSSSPTGLTARTGARRASRQRRTSGCAPPLHPASSSPAGREAAAERPRVS